MLLVARRGGVSSVVKVISAGGLRVLRECAEAHKLAAELNAGVDSFLVLKSGMGGFAFDIELQPANAGKRSDQRCAG